MSVAIELASELFKAHQHGDNDKIFYYEDDLLPILEKFGLPAPDWDGAARKNHPEAMKAWDDYITTKKRNEHRF